ncbi:uncharacterized protein LOC117591614 [Drosophila guanche]|uniref:uncharacterized protein LOC117591614 n=1 Tax=Drosophila guanche TaxID=7266 RepID=UPI001470B742|nr:uncharacterized protein LOC117591614 [Drosophila guanche]
MRVMVLMLYAAVCVAPVRDCRPTSWNSSRKTDLLNITFTATFPSILLVTLQPFFSLLGSTAEAAVWSSSPALSVIGYLRKPSITIFIAFYFCSQSLSFFSLAPNAGKIQLSLAGPQ